MNKNSILVAIAMLLTVRSDGQQVLTEQSVKSSVEFVYNDLVPNPRPPYKLFFNDTNLNALISIGLVNNADLLMAYNRVEIARAEQKIAKSGLLPAINGFGSVGGSKAGNNTVDGVGNKGTSIPYPWTPDYNVGLSFNWELDIWGKLSNRKKSAMAKTLYTAEGKNYVLTGLIAEIATRYYSLLSLDEQLAVVERNIELQKKALDVVRLQKEGGRATELAVKQFEAQTARTESMKYQIEQDIVTLENEINFLLARTPTTIARDKGATSKMVKLRNDSVPSDLLLERPDVRQAGYALQASGYDAKAAFRAMMPSLTIDAKGGFNAYNTTTLFDPVSLAYSVFGSLLAPVFNRNVLKTQYKIAMMQNKEAAYQYRKTIMGAYFEVSTTMKSLQLMSKKIEKNTAETEALEAAVGIANDLYLAGYANYLEVITAQKNALESELNLMQTKQKYTITTVSLYKALGGGSD